MSNFIIKYYEGQKGFNKGLYMGKGLHNLGAAINFVQRSKIYGIAAAPKVGKTTFTDYGFLLSPYLHSLKDPSIDVEWIYYSFEISRIEKEFDIATFFLFYDYGIKYVMLEGNQTVQGQDVIPLTPDYLRGRITADDDKIVKVKPVIEKALKEVYKNRIIPLFGEYSDTGYQLQKGKITFIEQKNNPTGIYKELKAHAETQGKFITIPTSAGNTRIIGYKADNPKKYTIVITDHLRKLIPERGYQKKQTIDKFIEYTVELRNWCDYTFVHIIHLNRSMTDESRIRQSGHLLYPNSDDIKDTGNLSEEANYMFTMFNPNDERYRLSKHFDLEIKDSAGNEFYPDLRTIHLVESRHSYYPQHFRTLMQGGIKNFEPFERNE